MLRQRNSSIVVPKFEISVLKAEKSTENQQKCYKNSEFFGTL